MSNSFRAAGRALWQTIRSCLVSLGRPRRAWSGEYIAEVEASSWTCLDRLLDG